MADSSSEQFLRPYRDAVKRHGPGFEATLWGSRDAQVLRFDVMTEMAGFEDCVVLDVGCGRGDFAARLLERNVAFRRFIGVDALEEMIAAARSRNLARCEFEVRNVLDEPEFLSHAEADFISMSGTLNTMDEASARGLVKRAFDAAAQGVVFNFLSDRPHARWADRDLTPAHRFETVRWMDWALGLTSRVSFTQSYLDGHDATMLILHDDA